MIRKLMGALVTLPSLAFSQLPENYWQQEVNYIINVELDDSLHTLTGEVFIEYTNNSPDDLDSIYFHLWPNAYSSQNSAYARQQRRLGDLAFHFSDSDDRGYIDGLNFMVDAKPVTWRITSEPDIAIVYLDGTLTSGAGISISTPFHVKIPKTFSRFGHDGQQYQITQWYPKPAVYDRHGWHAMPYLDMGEFYADVGSFEVNITLPDNYVVAATGNLQNPKEREWLSNRTGTYESRSSSKATKTLTYTEENIHDFAWFADKRYSVVMDSVVLPSGHHVTTWAFFVEDRASWSGAAQIVSSSLAAYSEWVGEYPYNNCTAVQGALLAGSGMEYPTITVIGDVGDALELVIAHEVGHNWFQGMFATNERAFAWMDEGLNSYYEDRYMKAMHPLSSPSAPAGNLSDLVLLDQSVLAGLLATQYGRQRSAPAINAEPDHFKMLQYAALVYATAARHTKHLAAYLGQSRFDGIMQSFFNVWKYAHPTPGDMQRFFENQAGVDLRWYFDGLIGSVGQLDYGIAKAKPAEASNSYNVTVKNHGDVAAPFSITSLSRGGDSITQWIAGFAKDSTFLLTVAPDATHLQLDAASITTDINPSNNTYKLRGAFKKTEPPQLPVLFGLPNPRSSQLFGVPVLGWNNYDGFIAGLAFYNSLFPAKKTEIIAVPMFGFKSTAPVGHASLTRFFYPKQGLVKAWSLGLSGKSFNYNDFQFTQRITKVQPALQVRLRTPPGRDKYRNLTFRTALIRQESARFNTTDSSFIKDETTRYANELVFKFGDRRALSPFNGKVALQHNYQMLKLQVEADQRITTKELPRDIKLRLFGGAFLVDNLSFPEGPIYRLYLSGPSGINDYMLDHVFLGRSEFDGFLYQQMVMAEGGFKVRTDKHAFGKSDQWLIAFNLNVPLPIPIPIDIFADVATFAGAGDQTIGSEPILWEVGVGLPLLPGIFEVYFPVFLSQDLKIAFNDGGEKYLQRVTFILQLEKLNPFQLIRELRGPN